jgi:hypothetical protein
MLCPALYLLQLIGELGLHCLIFIGLQVFQSLILLKGSDEPSELIDKGTCAMFDQVVDSDEHVEVLPGLFQIVLEDPDPVDGDIHNFLK